MIHISVIVLEPLGIPFAEGCAVGQRAFEQDVNPRLAKVWRAAIRNDSKWVLHYDGKGQGLITDRRKYSVRAESNRKWAPWPAGDPVGQELLDFTARDPGPSPSYVRGQRLHGPKVSPFIDKKHLNALRALDYVE